MMTLSDFQRERFVLLAEECAEVIQAVTKTLRFGLESVHPETGVSNKDRLEEELADLFAVIHLVEETYLLNYWKIFNKKNKKLETIHKYLMYDDAEP